MESWMVWLINSLIAAVAFLAWAFWMRHRYGKATEGKIMAEFWPETGMRYKMLLPVEVNGQEVKAPRGHQCPRYFFNKETTNMTRYPEAPFLNLRFLQAQVAIVSWPENSPEPISPHEHAPVATAALIDSLMDDAFAAFAIAASKEIKELEMQLAKALAHVLNKRTVYILLILLVASSAINIFLTFQVFNVIQYLKSAWGL